MKVSDAILPQGQPPELLDLLDQIIAILNNGRYQLRVIEEEPNFVNSQGEILIQVSADGATKKLWFFDGETWNFVNFSAGSFTPVPTGSILIWSSDIVPSGFIACNGAAISRKDFSNLFNIIGTTFGSGNGLTTFNVPDMRGRVPLCKDDINGAANRVTATEADNIGQGAGEENHTLTISELAAHTHVEKGAANSGGFTRRVDILDTNDADSPTESTTGSTGGGAPHNNMQPYLTVYYIIKS